MRHIDAKRQTAAASWRSLATALGVTLALGSAAAHATPASRATPPALAKATAPAQPAAAAQPAAGRMVAQLTLAGPIGPASAEYFRDASRRAVTDGAIAIVVRLDTPGGLLESMRRIISSMLACKIPVLVYVAPGGARAASAGTYILYAAQIAAMAPATHLGAATPVSLIGSTPLPSPKAGKPGSTADTGDAETHKILNDSIAYIRSLAQLRGRNAVWAEKAVRGAATLTADEAAKRHVIDFVAANMADLLVQASGREVQVGDHTVRLQLAHATVRDYPPSLRSRFLAIITDPTVAYLLLLAGIVGLLLEATHPGVLFPGVAGGICLLVGMYALQLLPVSFAGLALMALGIAMLVAEPFTPTGGALGFGGAIAFVVGSVMLMDTNVPGYRVNVGLIAGIAIGAAGFVALMMRLVVRARRARPFTGDEALRAESVELLEPVAANGEAWASVHGERWRVRCATALPAGARARIVRRQGLLLWIAPP
ncbi:MAG TPA: nodulation protein NfeD [Steroidobacteraceae bacterium]|nr:nodulation protein NfeD [Steroidobacteraceae bacterium]